MEIRHLFTVLVNQVFGMNFLQALRQFFWMRSSGSQGAVLNNCPNCAGGVTMLWQDKNPNDPMTCEPRVASRPTSAVAVTSSHPRPASAQDSARAVASGAETRPTTAHGSQLSGASGVSGAGSRPASGQSSATPSRPVAPPRKGSGKKGK